MNIPRILLAAGASGSGKTLITCGLLQALVNRKMKVASFKCGPDYIDPMFHSQSHRDEIQKSGYLFYRCRDYPIPAWKKCSRLRYCSDGRCYGLL